MVQTKQLLRILPQCCNPLGLIAAMIRSTGQQAGGELSTATSGLHCDYQRTPVAAPEGLPERSRGQGHGDIVSLYPEGPYALPHRLGGMMDTAQAWHDLGQQRSSAERLKSSEMRESG
jgi:hypothetical protein